MEKPLGRWFLRVVRVFAGTLFDDGHGVPADRLDWVTSEYGEFSARVGAKTRTGFRAAILAVQLLPVLFIGVPLPFTWLPAATRRRYLERLEASQLTFLVTALKIPLSVRYFEHPDVIGTLGYDGRPMVVLPEDAAHPKLAQKTGVPALPLLESPAKAAR